MPDVLKRPCSVFLLYLLLCCPVWSAGQEVEEEPFHVEESDAARLELLQEYLDWRRSHPLDINRAQPADWLALPWVTESLVIALSQAQKNRPGGFGAVADLLSVPGMTHELFVMIAPFLTVAKKGSPADLQLQGRHRWQWQPSVRGYDAGVYPGEPLRTYQRLLIDYGDQWTLGVLLEKDAGETGIADLQRTCLQWRFAQSRAQFIAGNFALQYGRGLVFPRQDGWGSGRDPLEEARPKPGSLRPALSTAENGHGGGLAFGYSSGVWRVYALAFRPGWDAVVDGDVVTNLQWSGLHRTAAEREHRKLLSANSYGLVLAWQPTGNFHSGLAWRQARYSHVFAQPQACSDRHDFSGDINDNASVFVEAQKRNLRGFAEIAASRNGRTACDLGLYLTLGKVDLFGGHVRENAGFQRLLTTAAPAQTAEKAWLLAGRWRLPGHEMVSFYYRYTARLWPSLRRPLPGQPRQEVALIIQHAPCADVTGLYRIRFLQDAHTATLLDNWNNPVKKWVAQKQWTLTGQWEWRPHSVLLCRSRIEHRFTHNDEYSPLHMFCADSAGWSLYQQMRITLPQRLSLTLRLTLFDALDYDDRLYAYENDLPGAFTMAMLYGRGTRLLALIRWQLLRRYQLSFRWERTRYDHQDSISTGWDEIEAAEQNTFGFQVDWQFSAH